LLGYHHNICGVLVYGNVLGIIGEIMKSTVVRNYVKLVLANPLGSALELVWCGSSLTSELPSATMLYVPERMIG